MGNYKGAMVTPLHLYTLHSDPLVYRTYCYIDPRLMVVKEALTISLISLGELGQFLVSVPQK